MAEVRGSVLVGLTAQPKGTGAQNPILAFAATSTRLWREQASEDLDPEWWDGVSWRDAAGHTADERWPYDANARDREASYTTRIALVIRPDGTVLSGAAHPPFTSGSPLHVRGDHREFLPITGGVGAAAWLPSGDLAVGGVLGAGGGLPLHGVAVQRGVMIDHLSGGVSADSGTAWVATLCARHDTLIAGGWFSRAGAVTAHSIAQWDGEQWQALGDGVRGDSARVEALLPWHGELIAAGNFTQAGGGSAANIARWDGATWSPLGTGLDGPVYALAGYNGDLIAGGAFTHAGPTEVPGVARWRGGAWQSLDGADAGVLGGEVRALAAWNGSLYLGGLFTSVGYASGRLPSTYVARWRDDGRTAPDAPPLRPARIVTVTGTPTTRVSRLTYELPQSSVVRATLYDIGGRQARVLVDAPQTAGSHVIEWRADDPALPAGVYRLVIDANGARTVRPVVVLR